MSKHIVYVIEVRDAYEIPVEAKNGNEAKVKALSVYRKNKEQLKRLDSPDHIIIVKSKGDPNLKEVDDVHFEALQDPDGGGMEV